MQFYSTGFNLESNGEHATARCNLPPNLSINLTGLGGEPGELGPKLDSLAILTDYSSKHRRTLTLEDALQLSAVLSRSGNARAQMSQRDWNLVISADKDAPAWLQLPSERESAIYVSNLPLSVTAEKLEGLLDSEAECNVMEVYLLKVCGGCEISFACIIHDRSHNFCLAIAFIVHLSVCLSFRFLIYLTDGQSLNRMY